MVSHGSPTTLAVLQIAAAAAQDATAGREEPPLQLVRSGKDRNQFNTRCSLSFFCSAVAELDFRSAHYKLMRESPFHAYVKCEPVTYPIQLIVDLISRYEGEDCFKIGPNILPFRPSHISKIMGIPNKGKPISLKADVPKGGLRRILGSTHTMNRNTIVLKLKEYLAQDGEAAVETSVKLWCALLCSCFFFPTSGMAGVHSVLAYLDDLHEMSNLNWAAAVHEHLMSGVKQSLEPIKAALKGTPSAKTTFLTGCVPALGVSSYPLCYSPF